MALHETHAAKRFTWRQPLPRTRPVDRHAAILEAAHGRRVVHVGFVDELVEEKLAAGIWLHERLARQARELVGLDLSERGVAWARERGYEAHAVDCQSEEAVAALGLEPADVVVAGEIVEHLDAPGPFLRAMLRVSAADGVLLVTTPNAYRLLNAVAPLSGSELVHPDHTCWHSPSTLRTLLERSGWRVERLGWYVNPPREGARAANLLRRAARAAATVRPSWSDGLVAWARPA